MTKNTETTETGNTFAEAIVDVQVALRHMGGEHEGSLAELLGEAKTGEFGINLLTPSIIGQLLMEVLPFAEDNIRPFDKGMKLYWIEVAAYMGPDWITQLRRVAAFMDKVESF